MTSSFRYILEGNAQGNEKLRQAATLATAFWAAYVRPRASAVVMRLGMERLASGTNAVAYTPYSSGGVLYGRVTMNSMRVSAWSVRSIAATITHELGHVIGYWHTGAWTKHINVRTGRFTADAVRRISSLRDMQVSLGAGAFAHWDEERHDPDVMTPFKDSGDIVHPATIDVVALMGHHRIGAAWSSPRRLDDLFSDVKASHEMFEMGAIDSTSLLVITPAFEELPHDGALWKIFKDGDEAEAPDGWPCEGS